jgi:anti-sigma B factor antagonist
VGFGEGPGGQTHAAHGGSGAPVDGNSISADGRAWVVRLAGDLDAAATRAVSTTVDRAVEGAVEGATDALVVDLTDVGFVDSSGARLLFRVADLCHGRGIELRIRGMGPGIRRDLELCGLVDVVSAD